MQNFTANHCAEIYVIGLKEKIANIRRALFTEGLLSGIIVSISFDASLKYEGTIMNIYKPFLEVVVSRLPLFISSFPNIVEQLD